MRRTTDRFPCQIQRGKVDVCGNKRPRRAGRGVRSKLNFFWAMVFEPVAQSNIHACLPASTC